MALAAVTPVLRIFDLDTARAFYVDFLGFAVDWEHRHEPDLPVYMQVSREACVLHLTEHHGDAAPGAALRIASSDLDALRAELAAKDYRYARPHIEDKPWGTRELVVWDPFHNRLTFAETEASEA
ncbi:MAG: glyoxalase superfamily protein [Bacteroidota bacterium]